jgi:hypothetical protein
LNFGLVRHSLGFIFSGILILTWSGTLAQERPENRVNAPAGNLTIKNDTVRTEPSDTLAITTDSLKNDTIQAPPKGDIETTINYSAKDSIRASVDGKMIWLYGEAIITYGSVEVAADEIIIDYANNTITAQPNRDSLGQAVGYPTFKNGSEFYETKGMTYNFKNRRARIREVITQQGEGFLKSSTAFKNENNEIYSIHNSYTTCNLEHPHFRIIANKTKAIPHDKIVSGPFYLEFNDIPLPAGFLFGMFPAQRESKSGIIFPSYGEERRRGFNFRGGGYFFDISDYVKLGITGDIYSKGSHAVYVQSAYTKRYAYNGSLNFTYSKNRTGKEIEDTGAQNDFRLTWSHSPQSKGTGRFAASVNAASSNFNKNNNLMYGAANELTNTSISNITSKLSSNISYSKRFAGTPFSMGLNLSHNQNLQNGQVDLSLPSITLNMTNQYPFQKKGRTGVLDNFMFGYSMAAVNRINNQIRGDSIVIFNGDNLPWLLRNSRKGVRFTIPVSYSFKALKYFTVSPSVSYNGRVYFERIKYRYNAPFQTTSIDTIEQVNFAGDYSFSTSVNTRIYGMYFFKRPGSKIKAIRHVINPNIGVALVPNFARNHAYFQQLARSQDAVYANEPTPARENPSNYPSALEQASEDRYYYQSLYTGSGFVYGAPPPGKVGALTFGIGNNLEMKVRSAKDTVDRKIMLLNNLSISSSYNFIADSLKLSNFSIAANTSILDNLINVNFSTVLDPYAYRTDSIVRSGKLVGVERRTKEYAWHNGTIGRITTANLGINTNLNPKMRDKNQSTREKVAKADIPESDKQAILQNPDAYVDFDIPWSANLSFSLTYSHPANQKPRFTPNLTASGDLSVSEKWKITYTSGYDFKAKEFTQTNFGISRDLHCWTMNLNWTPLGRFTSYNFRIAVKASILQDLKLERRTPFLDNL